MSTLVKSPERIIEEYHAEEYDPPILSIDWVGDFVFSDEESSLYMVETSSDRYRYTFGIESNTVLDVELSWS